MHLLSGKTLEARRAQRPQTIIQKGSDGFAMEFNGTDEYLTRALPVDIAGFNPATTNGGWVVYQSPTITSNLTTEAGSTTCIKIDGTSNAGGISKSVGLTIGKKYKIVLKYKATVDIKLGNTASSSRYGTIPATSQWNTKVFTITIVEDTWLRLTLNANGIFYVDTFTITEDWKMDLNESYELIKHSINRDFEQTLGNELWTNTTFTDTNADGLANGLEHYNTKTTEVTTITTDADGLHQKIVGAPDTRMLIRPSTLSQTSMYVLTISYKSTGNIEFITGNITGGLYTKYILPASTSKRTLSFDNYLDGRIGSGGIWFDMSGQTFQIYSISIREIPNLMLNGALTDPVTEWTAGTGCTFTGGVAQVNNIAVASAANFCTQNLGSFSISKNLRLSFEIKNYSSGSLKINHGGTVTAVPNTNSNGVKSLDFVQGFNSLGYFGFYLSAGETFVGEIDNIHIYELVNWVPSLYATVATNNHYGEVSLLDKYSGTQSFRITSTGAGRGAELVTNGSMELTTGWGAYNTTVHSYSTEQKYAGTYGLKINTTSQYQGVKQTLAVTSGKSYEVMFWLYCDSNFSGNITVNIGSPGYGFTPVKGMWVKHRYIITATANNADLILQSSSSANGLFYVDDVSVKEILGEVVLPYANIESCVAGKKYTIEGYAKLDPTSLTYGSDLFTSISHSATYPYETFTASGNDITSAINTTGLACAYVNIGSITVNEIVKVTFNLTLNSGSAPRVLLMQTAEAIAGTNSDTIIPVNGSNTMYFRAINYTGVCYLAIRDPLSGTTNFSISDIVVTKSSALAPTVTLQLGTKLVTSPALSIVQGTFTKFVLNFEATSAEVGQDLKLYLNGAGSVFVDAISLTQAYDMVLTSTLKLQDAIGVQRIFEIDGVINIFQGDNQLYMGYSSAVYQYGNEGMYVNNWVNLIGVNNRTDSRFKLYNNNVLSSGTVGGYTNTLGKQYATIVYLGKYGSEYPKFQQAGLQLIRFTNIGLSNFNATTFKVGQQVFGGGAETVLLLDWKDGTSINNTLKDYSPMNHTITGVNIDSTNRKRVN